MGALAGQRKVARVIHYRAPEHDSEVWEAVLPDDVPHELRDEDVMGAMLLPGSDPLMAQVGDHWYVAVRVEFEDAENGREVPKQLDREGMQRLIDQRTLVWN